jgi:hypothetical protein
MAVTSSSSKTTVKTFISRLKKDFPEFSFQPGPQDHWSPKSKTIIYKSPASLKETQYSLLHELAHAQLDHTTYHNDFELLKLESLAWELAAKLGKKYGVKITQDHIQDCLDTYRDWLHARSQCPTCGVHVLQKDPYHYHCFNCHTEWKVTSGRFVRPYRRTIKNTI